MNSKDENIHERTECKIFKPIKYSTAFNKFQFNEIVVHNVCLYHLNLYAMDAVIQDPLLSLVCAKWNLAIILNSNYITPYA